MRKTHLLQFCRVIAADPEFEVTIGTPRRSATGSSASASTVLVPRIAATRFCCTSLVALVTACCAFHWLSSTISSTGRPRTGPYMRVAVSMPAMMSSPTGVAGPLRIVSTPILSVSCANAGAAPAAKSASRTDLANRDAAIGFLLR